MYVSRHDCWKISIEILNKLASSLEFMPAEPGACDDPPTQDTWALADDGNSSEQGWAVQTTSEA